MISKIKPKTIILDIDGTLVKPRCYTPTEKVKEALYKEIDAGNEIVIATGRPLKNAMPIITGLNKFPITVLTSNGNLTIKLPSKKIISYHPLNINKCLPIIETLVKKGIRVCLVLGNKSIIEDGISYDSNVRIQDYYKIKTGDTNDYGYIESEKDKKLKNIYYVIFL